MTPETSHLLTDGRYQIAVRQSLAAGTLGPIVLEPVERRYENALAALLSRMGLSAVGFEAGHVTVLTFDHWRRLVPAVKWEPIDGLVESLRIIKDDQEVLTLRRGAALLSGVAQTLSDWIRIDRTELDIAREIDRALHAAGFSDPAFPTIVAAGPNSAHPHARPTSRRLEAGDLVLLDFGGVLDGYCVDLTRMAALGRVSPEHQSLFDAVREAEVAAFAAVRPGVEASEVDRAARDVLTSRGFGDAFVHATGHGLGLEVHERPRVGRAPESTTAGDAPATDGSDRVEKLAAGMVFTIEPGAYVEHLGGVRLEDDVLVTASGCEVLTTAPRQLMIL